MTNRLKWWIETPFVEKKGYCPPTDSDADVIRVIDSLVYTLNHYKQRIQEKTNAESLDRKAKLSAPAIDPAEMDKLTEHYRNAEGLNVNAATKPESLCKTCKNAPRGLNCLDISDSEMIGGDTIKCAGYTPGHHEEICPYCKQSIVLTDDGKFVQHNEPGWIDKSLDACYPVKCVGGGVVPTLTAATQLNGVPACTVRRSTSNARFTCGHRIISIAECRTCDHVGELATNVPAAPNVPNSRETRGLRSPLPSAPVASAGSNKEGDGKAATVINSACTCVDAEYCTICLGQGDGISKKNFDAINSAHQQCPVHGNANPDRCVHMVDAKCDLGITKPCNRCGKYAAWSCSHLLNCYIKPHRRCKGTKCEKYAKKE